MRDFRWSHYISHRSVTPFTMTGTRETELYYSIKELSDYNSAHSAIN